MKSPTFARFSQDIIPKEKIVELKMKKLRDGIDHLRTSRHDFVKEKLIERLIGREDYENFDKRPRLGVFGVTGGNATRS